MKLLAGTELNLEQLSKVLVIGKDKAEFKIGNQPIEEATTYKYLGNTINNKGTMQDHIQTVKGKCEATTQTILSIYSQTQTPKR